MNQTAALLTPTLLLGAAFLMAPSSAEACGCFAPPDPSVPVVQAGERIVFSHEDGVVTAHIQIQYVGDAQEFGWLLPLPSLPTGPLELGIEELFTQIVNTTQPKYRLTRVTPDICDFALNNRNGGVFQSSPPTDDAENVAILEDSIGPYDYAVLDASSPQEMFDWLVDNGYFIPTGTQDVVDPYIYDGAYFLALKLRKGESAGDIQPVVVRYAADYAMIPIVLTSVAANPDMGIQVWVLGEHRAIPRNYRHTILNDEHIDWFNAGDNYNDVIIAATNEAKDGQSFVTEYAGSVEPMRGLLDPQGRFGERSTLEQIKDPADFLSQVRNVNFTFGSGLTAVVKRHVGMPQFFVDQGLAEEDYYNFVDYNLGQFKQQDREAYDLAFSDFDPVALATELWERIVTPTLDAAALFHKHPMMTRMYTTLSADEMTKDPVFSFNPGLPDVSNEHEATFTYLCDATQDGPSNTPGILALPDGRRFYLENQDMWSKKDRSGVPYSRRIEFLREEGAPEIEIDNSAGISSSDAGADKGCACTADESESDFGYGNLLAALCALGIITFRRMRAPTR